MTLTREKRAKPAPAPTPAALEQRANELDWATIAADLDVHGCATIGPLLTGDECVSLAGAYETDALFRSRIVMARHGFGRGEYKYFAYPLPDVVAELRSMLYPPLAAIANDWNERMGIAMRYPREHGAFLERCRKAGQGRPTPLLLQYGPGDYNCLHQDLYGEHVFPLQVAFLLSQPGVDFTGGEFVLTEQRPRMQSRAEVVPLRQGEGVIFPVHHRPVQGRAGCIALPCGTGSAASARGGGTRWASSSTMRDDALRRAQHRCEEAIAAEGIRSLPPAALTYVVFNHKLTYMEKTLVYLRKEELDALRKAAARTGRSVAELVRESIRKTVLKPQAAGPVAIWDGKPKRSSVEHDSVHDEP